MLRTTTLISLLLLSPQPAQIPGKPAPTDAPTYTAASQLDFPTQYREWVFLTSGLDMSYDRPASAPDHSMFDNAFVNPAAYHAFLQTGTRPEGTVMILEQREAAGPSSINTRGKTQAAEVMGLLVHVKDATHGGWSFYSFDNPHTAKLIDRTAACYTCHQQHAAVDTTFVQFYPPSYPLAKAKATVSKEYLKDIATSAN